MIVPAGRRRWMAALILAAAALALAARSAFGQTLTVSGNPGLLRVTTAIAGSEPVPVSSATTTYTVVTPSPNRTYKVTAQLNAPMPAGLTLTAALQAPPGAVSLGPVALDATARDVVTGIGRNLVATGTITYQLGATVAAGVVPVSSRMVTLTIVRGP